MNVSKSDLIKKIKLLTSQISKFDVEYITSDPDWRVSFSDLRPELEKSIRDCTIIDKYLTDNFNFLQDHPIRNLGPLHHTLRLYYEAIRKMRNIVDEYRIDYAEKDPATQTSINKLLEDTKQEYNDYYQGYINQTSLIMSEINRALSEKNSKLEEDKANMTTGFEEDIQTVYSNLFAVRATNHRVNSRWWLGGIAVLSLLSICYVFCLIYRFNINDPFFGTSDYLNFFDHVALRVILFSLIGYVLHFMSRAYSFDKRQQIKNEDKDTALQCFPRFMRTSIKEDPELHRAVMLQITEAIFDTRDGDYMDDKGADKITPVSNLTLSVSKSD